jgi:hypothetical protein
MPMTSSTTPKLRFVLEFTELRAYEAEVRGYLSHVVADFGDGRIYPLFFYDIVRLQQDFATYVEQGQTYFTDPGMIIVERVTLANMELAILRLHDECYFDYLKPITEADLNSADAYQWPPTCTK